MNSNAGSRPIATAPPLASSGTLKPNAIHGLATNRPANRPKTYVLHDLTPPHRTNDLKSLTSSNDTAAPSDNMPSTKRMSGLSIKRSHIVDSVILKLQKPTGVIASRIKTNAKINKNIFARSCFFGNKKKAARIMINPGAIRIKYENKSSTL